MSSVSNNQVIELFKTVYGEMHDLVPDTQLLAKDIPFSQKGRVGTSFVEDVVLGDEVGISLGGTGQDAFEISAAIAGAVKQTAVAPYVSVLPSVLPFATVSRSLGDAQAFMAATKFIVKNNLVSHNKFLECFRLYGQADALLGYVSYATATYRGVSLTTGTGTVNSIAFTNGVNTSSKAILMAPGSFASGVWVGRKGVKVNQVDSTNAIVAGGKLVTVNSKYGYITVDFTPVAASSTTSHRLCFSLQETAQEMVGINKILNTSGTLFGINNSTYELFRGNVAALNGGGSPVKLTLDRVQEAIADAVNGGGLEGDVALYCNPRSWKTFAVTEAGLRVYDKSYDSGQAKNGFMDLEFYSQNGKITVKAHRVVKEGEAYCLMPETWSRSGSAQVGFKVPGMDSAGDLIKPLEQQAGYQFKSYSDEYIFCYAPARNILLNNINDESAT